MPYHKEKFHSIQRVNTMATISLGHNQQVKNTHHQREFITEEIEGLIRVHRKGHVERLPIMPNVSCTMATTSERGVTARDVIINKDTNLWARIYVPSLISHHTKLPLLVYFHGGGFCVGSAAWRCYHEFLTNLASKASCVIVSVDYKLAPENPLPTAYDDGFNALMWVKRETLNASSVQKWWLSHCNLSCIFLAGDSAGANIAYNVVTRLGSSGPTLLNPLSLKGVILIQPFFGGEERTISEKHSFQPPNSALTLSVSDTYWRLALPIGANRDHPYCNPLLPHGKAKLRDLWLPSIMVCVSEMDILKDRNLDLSNTLVKAGKRVETVIYKDVGHAFQVLHNYQLSHSRTQEMISHINTFLNQ